MNESANRRIEVARGNAVRGGQISSLGARGSERMSHSSSAVAQSNGRVSWVGKSRLGG